jgi:hypothetical protein
MYTSISYPLAIPESGALSMIGDFFIPTKVKR